jgi:hypothetical protein
MLMKLYTTKTPNNTIGKVLENETEYNIKFKSQADRTKPVVVLMSETMIDFNYAYIPDFNRYYFVESIEVTPNKIYNISLRCDVLESFKNDILASSGFVNQQTTPNKYYNSDYQTEIKKEVDVIKSNVTLDTTKSTILVTIGGV